MFVPECEGDTCIPRQRSWAAIKIALGHHFDDVIETVLMGMLYSGQFQAMMPKLHSTTLKEWS